MEKDGRRSELDFLMLLMLALVATPGTIEGVVAAALFCVIEICSEVAAMVVFERTMVAKGQYRRICRGLLEK